MVILFYSVRAPLRLMLLGESHLADERVMMGPGPLQGSTFVECGCAGPPPPSLVRSLLPGPGQRGLVACDPLVHWRRSFVHFYSVVQWHHFFLFFGWVTAPPKMVFPKRVPFFSRVTEQLSQTAGNAAIAGTTKHPHLFRLAKARPSLQLILYVSTSVYNYIL